MFEFNVIAAFLIAGGIVYTQGIKTLPLLRKLKFGQTVREDGPQSHLSKNGTPTMGGIIFISVIVIVSIFFGGKKILYPLSFMLLFGLVGFLDDYLKVVKKHNLGLKAYQKLAMQFLFAMILAIYQYNTSVIGPIIMVPFFDNVINLGILYIPFIIFFLLAVTNGVNLTDGLDGLASKVTIPVAICFAVLSYWVFKNETVAVFMASVAGALIGFLRINSYPAKVFMGDVGSMALGGAVAAAAVILNLELLILFVGIIYVLETSSVVIQVLYFKATGGKRFFRMAPLHHHFEEGGMSEKSVVNTFAIVSWIMAGVSILLMVI